MSLTVGVCIATRNRVEELRRTCAVLARLEPPPDEVWICADGCSDRTASTVQENHPEFNIIVHTDARGSIPSRNELAKACACDVFVSLDDDSYPLDSDFVAGVRALFEKDPRLAVASFSQRSDEFPKTLTATDFGPSHFSGTYVNCAAAIRRSVFLELGGYPACFFHAYEEPDFALRCVAAGWQVRHETSLTIRHHFTATQRSEIRTHQYHARNELWSVFLRCPAPQLFAVAAFRVARQFGYACRRGPAWAAREPVWWARCLAGLPRCFANRRPIPWRIYWNWMKLIRYPLHSEAEWQKRFGREEPLPP